jgi:hypothetical protein
MKALKLTLIIFALAMTETAMAQVGFGLKGGVNLTSLKLDDAQASYDSRTGFHAGVFLRAKFANIGIQPEALLFTQRGEADFGSVGKIEDSFTYLSIPVIFKFYPVGGLNLQAGPQFGFLLDGEQTYSTAIGTVTRDIKEAYKSSDVSLSVGAGYDFDLGLGLDVRYNIGIKDINNEPDAEGAKSRVFLVSLSWNFLK